MTAKTRRLSVPVKAGQIIVTDENPDDYIGDRYVQPAAAPAPAANDAQSGLIRRVLGDGAVTALKGAIGVPEAAVGLADIAAGGHVGRALENRDGSIGFRPGDARAYLDTLYSPEQQAAFKAVQTAANPDDPLRRCATPRRARVRSTSSTARCRPGAAT